MPFTETDCTEILQELRETLRSRGFGDVDERLVGVLDQRPYFALVHYLKALLSEISLGTDGQVRRILREANEILDHDGGGRVAGIQLVLTPDEAQLYQTETVEFGDTPELTSIVEELHSILTALLENGPTDEPPNRNSIDRFDQ